MKQEFRYAFRQTIPIMAGYLSMGIAYGLLLQNMGYNVWWSGLSSLFIYAGAMQFVMLNFLKGGFSLISVAVMTLLVNSRHMFYGLSFLEVFPKMGKKQAYMIQGLTDETYSLLCSQQEQPDLDMKKVFFFITLLDHNWWTLGSVLGSLVGSLITFDTTGLDFAMTALFVVIFTEQWLSAKSHLPALIGGITALICLPLFGPSNFILPTLIFCVAILLALKPIISAKTEEEKA